MLYIQSITFKQRTHIYVVQGLNVTFEHELPLPLLSILFLKLPMSRHFPEIYHK